MLNRQRYLVAVLSLLLLVILGVAWLATEHSLRREQDARISSSLAARGDLAMTRFDIRLDGATAAELDAEVRALALAGRMRVTLIARDGTVLADSSFARERMASLENHRDRPEVREALAGRIGSSKRASDTIGRELFYRAHPIPNGVLRVAVEGDSLDTAVGTLRRRMGLWGAGGLVCFIAAAYVLSRQSLAPLREMQRAAASIAEGHLDDRLPLDPGDELRGLSSAVNEIAEQLRARFDEVAHEKDQLRAVLEGMVEAVLVVDTKGVVLLANSRLRELYGATGEIRGRPVLEGIRDTELDVLLTDVRATDAPLTRDLKSPGTNPRSLRVHASRFPPGDGPRAGSVLVFHDVTEIERLEEVRRDFVANASHELRTPLTAIHGFAETLLGDGNLPDSDRRSYLEVIDRHAKRLGTIVNDLLELSTIETGKIRLDPTEVDLAQVVANVVRDVAARCSERDLEVRSRAEGASIAFADPRATEQVVTNLVDNAVKYTEPGGRIDIEISERPAHVRVSVADSGIGIPAEDLARIFERFYRVDKARSRALGGTGLGLSIVKHLVQGMGGTISVESELGKGSRFIVSLPRASRESVS